MAAAPHLLSQLAHSTSPSLNLHMPPITIKLDRTNYSLWRSTILSALEAYELDSFVLSPTPPQETRFLTAADGSVTTEANPAFLEWRRSDRIVLIWLKSTMTDQALAIVARSSTAQMAWLSIDKAFQSQTRARRMAMRGQLQSITKGALSMMEYIEKKLALADSLAETLHPVADEDLIGYILDGLDSTYGPFTSAFMMRSEAVHIDDLTGLLLNEEARLERELTRQAALLPTPTAVSSFSSHSANAAARFPGRFSSSRPSSRGSGPLMRRNNPGSRYANTDERRGTHVDNRMRVICQICNRPNHEAVDCWNRSNHTDYPSRRHPPTNRDSSRQANIAQSSSSSSVMDPSWYFDSGATDHVTPDLTKLSIADDYTGTDKLQVGDEFSGQHSSPRGR
ncbi:Retrovirus-related Pol polyprotein from transposon RE1 [Linum perenne]